MRGYEANNSGNRIRAVVVMLQCVSIAMAVEIIDDRVGLSAGLVVWGQEDPVVTGFTEDLRRVGLVLKRLVSPGRPSQTKTQRYLKNESQLELPERRG